MSSDSRSSSCFRFSTMLANLGSRIRRMLSRQAETSSSEESITDELINYQSSDEVQDEEVTENVVELQHETDTNPSPSSPLNNNEENGSKSSTEVVEKHDENGKSPTKHEDHNDSTENMNKDKKTKISLKGYTNISCRIRISRANKSEYNKLSKLKRKLESNTDIIYNEHKHTQTDELAGGNLTTSPVTENVEIAVTKATSTTAYIKCEKSTTENVNTELNENEVNQQMYTSESGQTLENIENCDTKTSAEGIPASSESHTTNDDETVILDLVVPLYLNNKLHFMCKEYIRSSNKGSYCIIILDDRVPYHQLFSIIKQLYSQLVVPYKPSKFLRDKATQTNEEAWNKGARQMTEYLLSLEPSTVNFNEESAARILKFIGKVFDTESNLSDFFNCREISEFADSEIPIKFHEQISHLRLDFFKIMREHGKIYQWVKLSGAMNFKTALRQHLQIQIDILVGSCLFWYKVYDSQTTDLDLSSFLTEYLAAYEAYVLTIRHSGKLFASQTKTLEVKGTSTADTKPCKSQSFETGVLHESEESKQEISEKSIEDTDSIITGSSCGCVDEIEQELEELEKEMRGNKMGCFYLFEQTDGIFDRGTEYWIDGQAAVSKSRKGARGDYIDRPKKKKTRGIPNKHLQNECTFLIQNETNNVDDCKAANRSVDIKPEPEVDKIVLDPLFPCEIEESDVDIRHLKSAPAIVITGKKNEYEHLEVAYETLDKKPNKQRHNKNRKQQRANRQKTLQFGLNTNNCADDEYESSSDEDNCSVLSRITYRENSL